MEKKDYLSLQSKYSLAIDYQERYRKELLDFIHEAFEKHGNEFEYKCDTHATWQEKNEDEEDEFDAMNDLPVCVTIWVDDDGGHEVYPTVIRQYGDSHGYKCIEADGWDWYDSSWVKYQQIHSSIDELQSVADFINAVLEQEQEEQVEERELIGYQIDFGEEPWPEGLFSFQVFRTKKNVEDYIFLEELDEKYYDRIVEIYRGDVEDPSFLGTRVREFGKNEEVMVYDGLHYYAAIVETDITIEDDDETMPVFPIGPDGKCMSPVDVEPDCVYKKALGKTCPKCGKPLYIEHNEEIDYPYFCPDCDENFYGREVR